MFQQALLSQFQLPSIVYTTISPAGLLRRRLTSASLSVNATLYATSVQQGAANIAVAHALEATPSDMNPALFVSQPGTTCVLVQLLSVVGGCEMSPCHAGALCTDGGSSYTCACPAGFAGNGFSTACVACGPLAAPAVSSNVQNGSFAFSSLGLFQALLTLPSGSPDGSPCNFSAAYTWRVTSASGAVVPVTSTTQSLTTAPRSLPVSGGPYAFTVTACFQSNSSLCSPRSTPIVIATVATPLVAAISGGNSAYQASTTAVLDGRSSVDPDDPSGSIPLSFAWRCFVGSSMTTPCSTEVATSSVLTLSSALQSLSPGTYTFQLTVSKDTRVAAARTSVTLESPVIPPHPTVSIAATTQSVYLNPSSSLTLSATAVPFDATDSVTLQWSISPLSSAMATALGLGVLDDPCMAAQNSSVCTVSSTSTSSATFVLVPGALTANGGVYTLRVTATEAGVSSWADIVLPPLARRPQGGSLGLLGASTGIAVTTPFTFTAFGWTAGMFAEDLPLSYSLAATPANAPAAAPVALLPFMPSSQSSVNITIYLPAGSWTLLVLVASARGAQATPLAAPQTVFVSPASAAQISTAASNAVALADAGQLAGALQLAVAVTQSTNASSVLPLVIRVLDTVLVGTAPTLDTVTASISSETLVQVTTSACALSIDARDAALAACTFISNAFPAVCSSGVAQNTLNCLSALSACLGSSSSYQTVQNALTALVNSSQACLSVPGQVPIVLNSSSITFHVGLEDVSGSANSSSGLFGTNSSGLACGSGSVGAVPASTLEASGYNGSAVQVSLVCTAYNSNSDGPPTGAGSYSGALSLELSDANGTAIAVPNSSTPFPITLPACPTPPCQCTYWDVNVNASSSDGCVGLPLPLPPGVIASFNASLYAAPDTCPNTPTSRAARLLRTLQLAGLPMKGCTATILDCPEVGDAGIAYLNPDNPLKFPAVVCPNVSTDQAVGLGGVYTSQGPPALLVFSGAACELWKTDNAARCWWNATSQLFTGPGCVAANKTSCLCTHLTSFSAFSAPPSVNVASQKQMTSLNPVEAFTKATVFAIVTAVLFTALHLSAFLSAVTDRRWRNRLRAKLFSDAFGFVSGSKQQGAWLWTLSLSTHKVTGGSALRFAAAVGIPLVRLQLAIPEELLDLSVAPSEPPAKTLTAADTAKQKAARSMLTSTALVFALIVHLELVQSEEFIAGQAEATRYFTGLGTGLEFKALVSLFTEMLANDTLTRRDSWIDAARLWRFILLRNRKPGLDGGGWEPSSSLAFALFAVDLPVPEPTDGYSQFFGQGEDSSKGAPVFWQRPLRAIRDYFRNRGLARAEEAHAELREQLAWHGRTIPQQPWRAPVPDAELDALAFSLPAIVDSVPDFLAATFVDHGFALRLWTTLLSLTVLESLTVCWAAEDRTPTTMLDETETWVANAVARQYRGGLTRAASLLRTSTVPEELVEEVIKHARRVARETILRWKLAHEHRLLQLRTVTHSEGGIWRSYRVLGEAVASLQQKHHTASAMLSPVADGLTRVHRAVLLITTLLTALTVQTWLYWSRAFDCCAKMRREKLGCDSNPLVPCRGFTGDCADLRAQFSTLAHTNAHADLSASGPWAWTCSALDDVTSFQCHAFPDDSSSHDRIYVGLIVTAVALPVHHVLGVLLHMSTEPDLDFNWLSMQPLLHMLASLLRLRTLGGNWRWRGSRPFWIVRHLQRYSIQPFKSVLERLCAILAGLVIRSYGHNAAARRTLEQAPPDERAAIEAELLKAVARRVAGVLGLLLVYIAWAVCVWFCLEYGILLFGLQGVESEVSFLKDWAISVAVQSAYQMRYAVQALLVGLLSHFAFEEVHVAPQHSWFEVWLDSMSVQAAVAADFDRASPWSYAHMHLRHFRSIAI